MHLFIYSIIQQKLMIAYYMLSPRLCAGKHDTPLPLEDSESGGKNRPMHRCFEAMDQGMIEKCHDLSNA